MAVLHNTLSGADLHEPKGIAGAFSGQVYTSNGGGSGYWGYPIETINLGPVSIDGTGNFSLTPIAHSARIINVVFTMWGSITSSGSTDVVVHLKSASGVNIATASFPVLTTSKGSTVTVPVSFSVVMGSYVELGITAQGTSSINCSASIAMEVM